MQQVLTRVQRQALGDTRNYYEAFPFIEGGARRIQWWQEYLKPFLPDEIIEGRLVGDIGSGIGEISRGLSNRGARVCCLDLTLTALRRCHEINPTAPLFHGNALQLPFADGAFDHAISIGVLMVTPDTRRGMAEVARVTAPGGRVVLFIYNYWCYLNFLYQIFKPVRAVLPLSAVPDAAVRVLQPFVRSHLGEKLDVHQLRRLLGDKLWTPHATFHTLGQIRGWAAEVGLEMTQWKRFYHSYANVMAFTKSGTPRREPTPDVTLRCVSCGHAPLRRAENFRCGACGHMYEDLGGIYECLPSSL